MWKAYDLIDTDLVVLGYVYGVMFEGGGRNLSVIPLARENFAYPAYPHTRSPDLILSEKYTQLQKTAIQACKNKYTFQGWIVFWVLNSYFAAQNLSGAMLGSGAHFFLQNPRTSSNLAKRKNTTPTSSDVEGECGGSIYHTPIWRPVISTKFVSHKNLNTC